VKGRNPSEPVIASNAGSRFSSAKAKPALAGRPPRIANAIADATGKRLRDLPLTRKRIKDAIDA
jgi:CO/xanthine dehydrogenase Mo-binding subunit